jgi:hypothetical protein
VFGTLPVQVVVDSEATAKALLSRGQLRNRVTIIPLNKARTPPHYLLKFKIKFKLEIKVVHFVA